jgi:hypothetical protein
MVCSPKLYDGLGAKNLNLMNHALRLRWHWLERGEEEKPWKGLKFKLAPIAEDLFK